MSNPPIISHGRGGNANIGPDSQSYIDSEIVRTGPQGDQGGMSFLPSCSPSTLPPSFLNPLFTSLLTFPTSRRTLFHRPRRLCQHRRERLSRHRSRRQRRDPPTSDDGGETREPSLWEGGCGEWYVLTKNNFLFPPRTDISHPPV